MDDLFVGIGIALVIEGLLYAAFPEQMKAMLLQLFDLPGATLRTAGLFSLAAGVFVVWLVRG